MRSLPYDEWVEIDELTCRRLFEDIIQKGLKIMGIEGDGGDFERTMRKYLLYFVPEYEYYWPPYAPPEEREVKFPVKVKKEIGFGGDGLVFHLGRYADEERDVGFFINTNNFRSKYLNDFGISVRKKKYLPGIEGPPKIEGIRLFINLTTGEVELNKDYIGDEGDPFYTPTKLLKQYELGNPEPIVDNTKDEPPVDLSGVELLLDGVRIKKEGKWYIWDPALFQTFRSIINLCKLQLNLADNGHELEKVLWRDFFRFDYGPSELFGVGEFANVKLVKDEPDRKIFLFDVGNIHTARLVYVTLTKDKRFVPEGFDWGVEVITVSRPIMINGAIGEEIKEFEFIIGEGGVPCADYTLTRFDNAGYTVFNKTMAYFRYNIPYSLVPYKP